MIGAFLVNIEPQFLCAICHDWCIFSEHRATTFLCASSHAQCIYSENRAITFLCANSHDRWVLVNTEPHFVCASSRSVHFCEHRANVFQCVIFTTCVSGNPTNTLIYAISNDLCILVKIKPGYLSVQLNHEHVKDPGHSAKGAGGRLQINTYTPCVCGFAWSDMVQLLYGVHRTCAGMDEVSCGTSHASAVNTPLRWIFKTKTTKKLAIHVEPHASAASLLKRAENSAIIISNHQSIINQSVNQ